MNLPAKMFYMIRRTDETGVSGTGIVLYGAVFPDGITVIHWCTKKKVNCTSVFNNFEDFKYIHIDCHPKNKTEVVWIYKEETEGENKKITKFN